MVSSWNHLTDTSSLFCGSCPRAHNQAVSASYQHRVVSSPWRCCINKPNPTPGWRSLPQGLDCGFAEDHFLPSPCLLPSLPQCSSPGLPLHPISRTSLISWLHLSLQSPEAEEIICLRSNNRDLKPGFICLENARLSATPLCHLSQNSRI